jgi:hypothetical protein
VNDKCEKIMHMGMMERGFTVLRAISRLSEPYFLLASES